jgi:hypothetical protein
MLRAAGAAFAFLAMTIPAVAIPTAAAASQAAAGRTTAGADSLKAARWLGRLSVPEGYRIQWKRWLPAHRLWEALDGGAEAWAKAGCVGLMEGDLVAADTVAGTLNAYRFVSADSARRFFARRVSRADTLATAEGPVERAVSPPTLRIRRGAWILELDLYEPSTILALSRLAAFAEGLLPAPSKSRHPSSGGPDKP